MKKINIKCLYQNTSEEWNKENPLVPAGILIMETDTNKLKFSDGETRYNDLEYLGCGNPSGDYYTKSEIDDMIGTIEALLKEI